MHWKVLLTVTLVLSLYVVISGVIFHFIEFSNEGVNKDRIANATATFLAQHPCVDKDALRAYAIEVMEAYDSGVLVPANQTEASHWDIPGAIFFATTVVTTIGYGHISPNTVAGQIYCVFFALTGIPVCLAMLSGIGETINSLKSKIDKSVSRACKGSKKTVRCCRNLITTLLAISVFVMVPAVVFMVLEDWSFGVSFYYVIITLSTVGFGDYVAGLNQPVGVGRAIYRILLCVYIILGLAWLASCISSIQESFTQTTSHVQDIKIKRKSSSHGDAKDIKGSKVSPEVIEVYEVEHDVESDQNRWNSHM